MKVSKCGMPALSKPEPKKWSFAEMSKVEGVYKLNNETGDRWIVVSIDTVLFYGATSQTLRMSANSGNWHQYIRVENAEVCFEIREK